MHSSTVHRGCKLSFSRGGHGPPVLFIQGVGLHGDGWLPQTNGLRRDYACVSFDNRGTGASDTATGSITVQQMADDALAILDAVGWPSAHVVGHSLGGMVALEMALTRRARVRSLALVCSLANGSALAPMTPRMVALGLRTRIGTRRMRRRAFLQLILSPAGFARADADEAAKHFEPLFGHDLGVQPPVVAKQLKALRAYNATNRLSELIGLPTLVISAEHDPIAPPRLGRQIADGIRGSRFVKLAGASHGAPIEFADKCNDLLRAHFSWAELLHSPPKIPHARELV